MDRTTALQLLRNMIAYTSAPTLPSGSDDLLLDNYGAVVDAAGLLPSDANWVPTWDLNNAAATGWDWKANLIADRYDGAVDGQSLSRSQWYDHCVARAKEYRRRRFMTVTVPTDLSRQYPSPPDTYP